MATCTRCGKDFKYLKKGLCNMCFTERLKRAPKVAYKRTPEERWRRRKRNP